MHRDSPTPPKDKAGGDRPSSGKPTWTTWQRLDEDLPQWDSWSTLADGPSSASDSADGEPSAGDGARPSRRPPGIKSFRLSDTPSAEEFSDAGADDRARRPSDAPGSSPSEPTVELYNHRPLFSSDSEQPRPISPPHSGDGHRSSGDGHRSSGDGHRTSGDGHRSAGDGRRTSGDGHRASRDRYRPSGDGVRHSGDGHRSSGEGYASRDGAQARGDGYTGRNEARGDGYTARNEARGDGYTDRNEARGDGYTGRDNAPSDRNQTRGDGYGHPSSPSEDDRRPTTEGDGYSKPQIAGERHTSPRGDGVKPPSSRGDGHQNPAAEGDGYQRPADQDGGFANPDPRGTGSEAPEVRGDGFERVQADGFDSGAIQGDGFEAGAIQGDGFDTSAAEDQAEDLEPEENLEPWNDLSDYVQVPTAAPQADQDTDSDEGFSALDLRDRVVIMLLFKQVIQIDAVEKAHRRWQKESGGKSKEPLWRVLTMDPAFDRDTIFAEAAQVYAFKQATLDKKAGAAFIKKHKDTFAETFWDRMTKLRVLPISQETQAKKKEKRTIFVSHDPSRPDVNRLMRELKLDSFELQYAPEAEIDALIHEAFPKRNEYLDRVSDNEFAFDLGTSYDQSTSLIDEDALEAEISRSSLINLFEASLVEAVRRGVSDIHIFPNPRKQIEIHFRVDGELECWHREERVHPEAFLAVVKDNTLNVDRFERDTAQDGFIQRKVDDTLIRYRVSVLPVANANQEIRSESIVIRVLDDRKVITDLGRLGLLDQARAKFEWAIRQPHGMVILTGPTGSGKTTTLFAALHQVVTDKVNVLTVEDPVEYVIPGVRQIKLSHKLTLEQALRSILRHDPDIVMVGEMRDRDTAELAIKLANTGHLTFSTLHTNDAPSAVSRLYKMGVEPFLIAYAINLVVAQRLLRTLCAKCKRPMKNIDHEMLLRLGFTQQELAQARFYDDGHNPDCRACGGTGYKGRRAITETMAFTDEIRRKIVLSNEMIDEDGLRRQAVADGMLTLRGSAREIVKQGDTSVTELIRVTAGEH